MLRLSNYRKINLSSDKIIRFLPEKKLFYFHWDFSLNESFIGTKIYKRYLNFFFFVFNKNFQGKIVAQSDPFVGFTNYKTDEYCLINLPPQRCRCCFVLPSISFSLHPCFERHFTLSKFPIKRKQYFKLCRYLIANSFLKQCVKYSLRSWKAKNNDNE